MKKPSLTMLFSALVLGFFTQCAHVEAPSGGKLDKVPPQVLGVFPARNQLNFDLESPLKIQFTEWMNENLGPMDVQLSPPVIGGLEWEMLGDELVIQPRTALDSNTTYTLLLTRDLKDLRSNPLDLPFSLTFSTGPILDSLFVEGRVYTNGFKPAPPSTRIGLYPKGKNQREKFAYLNLIAKQDSLSADTLPRMIREFPLYKGSTDSTGFFKIKGIAPGEYRLAAFVDGNRNGIINPEFEDVALYIQDIVVTENTSLASPLTLGRLDKTPFLITGITPIGKQFVEVKFNRPIMDSLENISVKSDSLEFIFNNKQTILRPNKNSILLQFDTLVNSQKYIVNTSTIRSEYGEYPDSLQREFPFTFQELPLAENNNFINSTIPNGGTLFKNEQFVDLHYQFPWQSQKGDSLFLMSSGDTLVLKSQLEDPFTLRVSWDTKLPLSSTFQLIRKVPPSDSLPEGYKTRLLAFNTADPLKMGSLKIKNLLNTKVQIKLRHLEKPFVDSLSLLSIKDTLLEPIPEGPTLIEYYIDANNNNRRDAGTIDPWTPAEAAYLYPDTLLIPRTDTLEIAIPLEQN